MVQEPTALHNVPAFVEELSFPAFPCLPQLQFTTLTSGRWELVLASSRLGTPGLMLTGRPRISIPLSLARAHDAISAVGKSTKQYDGFRPLKESMDMVTSLWLYPLSVRKF